MKVVSGKIQTCIFFLLFVLSACKRDNSVLIVDPEPTKSDTLVNIPKYLIDSSAFVDAGNINIRTIANGNSWDISEPALLKDISGNRSSYCHPDVEYFEQGFHGYKYWMAFTPYFGTIGSSGDAILYENPTIVTSNDGLNWQDPANGVNPIQKRPSLKDAVVRNSKDTLQGYWSDTDLIFADNQLHLYYRGSSISKEALKRIISNSSNNQSKTESPGVRTIVKQVSRNGVDWSPVEMLYSSNEPYTINHNDVLSPSFVKVNNSIYSYEVLFNRGKEGYKENDNSFVLKRRSNNGLDFTSLAESEIVRFDSKPWKNLNGDYSPWHIQATYVDNYYFLYIAAGKVTSFTSESLFIAYSKDGSFFKVYPEPIVKYGAYRSCIYPMRHDTGTIELGSVIGMRTGQFKQRRFKVSKALMRRALG